ncbi:MAG: hypothetical protein NTW08_04800 [Gammaproteobacteria bacterium]|nr:hypothetical protein [Gammaproteobacteria bacterium]
MTTYFSTKKHEPLTTGVTIDEVMEKVVAPVSICTNTVGTLAETHPEEDNRTASEAILKWKQGLFSALNRNKTQTIQASTSASTTVAPTPTDAPAEVAPKMGL